MQLGNFHTMNVTRLIKAHFKPLKVLLLSVIGTLIVASLSFSDVMNRRVSDDKNENYATELQRNLHKKLIYKVSGLAKVLHDINKDFKRKEFGIQNSTMVEQVILPNNRIKFVDIGTFQSKQPGNEMLSKNMNIKANGIAKEIKYIYELDTKRERKQSNAFKNKHIRTKLPKVWRIQTDGLATAFKIDNDFKFTVWNFTSKRVEKDRSTHEKYVYSKQSRIHYDYFQRGYSTETGLVGQFMERKVELCDGRFIGYAHLFAELTNVLVDPSWGSGKVGGENLSDVMYQSADNEYYDLHKRYFKLPCTKKIKHLFPREDPLWEWTEAISVNPNLEFRNVPIMENTTIFVKRYEYANMYHTMTDLYNAFLMHVAFRLNPDSTTIVWIDAHPKGGLDPVWNTLFGKVIRAGQVTRPIVFKKLIWSMMGDNSPISDFHIKWNTVPFLEEFRHFFLTRHGISPYRKLNCSNVTVSFIWRRNYIAHPRNPSGKVQRKIKNEDELIHTLKNALPFITVRGAPLDSLSMTEQLQYITETDILIGMHGAGMTHALFLQKHAAVVELHENTGMLHFWAFAKWRRLVHASWLNEAGPDREGYHYIPPKLILGIVKQLISGLCWNR